MRSIQILILIVLFPFISWSQNIGDWSPNADTDIDNIFFNWYEWDGSSWQSGFPNVPPNPLLLEAIYIGDLQSNVNVTINIPYSIVTGGKIEVSPYSTLTLDDDLTIESGGDLYVASRGNLVISSGATLTIKGTANVLGTITNNGDIVVESTDTESGSLIYNSSVSGEYKQEITSGVWHLVGIPVNKGTGATVGHFNPSGGDGYMRAYETANSAWGDYMYTESEQLNVGQGYEYWTTEAGNTVVSVTGTFNTGTVNLTLSSAGNQYNCIANPYPCALDWETVSDRTNTLTQSVYYYSNTEGTNGYAVYSASTSTGTYGATQYIPPFQGFFVEQTSGTSMSFNNSNKAHPDSPLYKSVNQNVVSDRVRIKIAQDTLWAETVIVNLEDATNDYDVDYDTKMPDNAYVIAPEIYSKASEENIMINAISSYPAVVPLELDVLEAGTIIMTVSEMSLMQDYTVVELEDRETGEFYTVDDNFSGISFDVVEGILSDRFFVHYSSTVGFYEFSNNNADIYSYGNSIYIRDIGSKSDVQIFNLTGQLIYSGVLNPNSVNTIQLDQPSAYYVVKVIGDQNTQTEKLYIAQ